MGFLRRILSGSQQDNPTVNPNRTEDLYATTPEGYIIAEDIACQYEFVEGKPCPSCGGALHVAAQINRASQGLNELVCTCENCHQGISLIFDISNDVYQSWLKQNLGKMYIRNYDGPPRRPTHR